MPQLRISPRARSDLLRLYQFLASKSLATGGQAIDAIEAALIPLTHMPKIGRPVADTIRELIIDFGSSGYIALYDFDEVVDEVIVLAVRHQRERDYS
ncbi:MAG: type II toxin-antitoxin system RelE/ParE family toxin [Comamonadaceae bacterium]|nr:type II toxin-antitoxin system RelE/ParE family toxin [Comamonadaceae bacterium]